MAFGPPKTNEKNEGLEDPKHMLYNIYIYIPGPSNVVPFLGFFSLPSIFVPTKNNWSFGIA